jgi:hypothetical protein
LRYPKVARKHTRQRAGTISKQASGTQGRPRHDRTTPPVTPGELLCEEFLKPLGITQYRLAKEIGVPPTRIGAIISGRRSITADTDLRL